ncbi:MAG TPA: type II secretion system protein, partial [Candidatus Acidoferrales bacterium]|nr:type II secretion system protein [Candidatus Acidoferrales bacterium]
MRRLLQNRGVTLIETVVSLAVLSITLAAVGQFLTTQIRASSSNNLSTVAYGIAEKEMEDMRTLDYNSMVSRSATQTQGNITFATTTTVYPDTPSANMKKIIVQVGWNDQGTSKNVQV